MVRHQRGRSDDDRSGAAGDRRDHRHNDTTTDDVVRRQAGESSGRSDDGAARGRVGDTVPDLDGVNCVDNHSRISDGHRGYDSDLGRDGSCLRDKNSDRNDIVASASVAGIGCDSGDISQSEETASQSSFIRQQRMKWLEANSHSTSRQMDSQSELVRADKSGGSPDEKPDPAARTVHESNRTIAAVGMNSPVAARHSDATESHRTTGIVTGNRRTETKTQPAVTASAGNETERNGAENGRKRTDGNPARNCRNSQTESGGIKVMISGSTNDVSEQETDTATEENCGGDKRRSERLVTSDTGISHQHHRTESESRLQQQRVPQARADASLKLSSSDNHQYLDTPPKAVVEEVDTVDVSFFSDQPSSCCQTRDNLHVTAALDSVEVPASGTGRRFVPETGGGVSLELHNVLKHLKDLDGTDSGSATRSDEFLNPAFTPLNEDTFDVYVKNDRFELQSQGCSTSESLSAQLQLDFPTIEPPEGFADTDETLLKLPVMSTAEVVSNEREEAGLSEAQTECQQACESSQDMTSNRRNVEGSVSNVKSLPYSMHLWSCVYSRNEVGVGEVSTRISPIYRGDKNRSSVLDSDRTPVEGIGDKSDVAHSQASNCQSAFRPVCVLVNERDSATNDVKLPVTRRSNGTSQELSAHTPGELECNSAKSCITEENVRGNVCEKFATDVPLASTTQETEPVCRRVNAVGELRGADSIDNLNSLTTGETNRSAVVETRSRLTDRPTEYEIPAAMEADFIDQMHHETCSSVALSSTADFSSETPLNIIITHVVDSRHFWGQIVNERIQVTYAVIYPLSNLSFHVFFGL